MPRRRPSAKRRRRSCAPKPSRPPASLRKVSTSSQDVPWAAVQLGVLFLRACERACWRAPGVHWVFSMVHQQCLSLDTMVRWCCRWLMAKALLGSVPAVRFPSTVLPVYKQCPTQPSQPPCSGCAGEAAAAAESAAAPATPQERAAAAEAARRVRPSCVCCCPKLESQPCPHCITGSRGGWAVDAPYRACSLFFSKHKSSFVSHSPLLFRHGQGKKTHGPLQLVVLLRVFL